MLLVYYEVWWYIVFDIDALFWGWIEQKIVELSWAMMNAVDKRIDEWVMVVQGNQSSKFEEDDD